MITTRRERGESRLSGIREVSEWECEWERENKRMLLHQGPKVFTLDVQVSGIRRLSSTHSSKQQVSGSENYKPLLLPPDCHCIMTMMMTMNG